MPLSFSLSTSHGDLCFLSTCNCVIINYYFGRRSDEAVGTSFLYLVSFLFDISILLRTHINSLSYYRGTSIYHLNLSYLTLILTLEAFYT